MNRQEIYDNIINYGMSYLLHKGVSEDRAIRIIHLRAVYWTDKVFYDDTIDIATIFKGDINE